MLKKRLITALFGLPVLSLFIWSGEPFFTVFASICGLLATFEFYRMVGKTKAAPLTVFGLCWSVLFIINPHLNTAMTLPFLLSSAVVGPLIWLLIPQRKRGFFDRWVWTIAGIIYVGLLLSYLVALRSGYEPLSVSGTEGRNWVFYAVFTTFGSDTAAFFIGRSLGKHRLAPSISPGKSREGAIGGFLGAVLVSLIFILPTKLMLPLSYWQAILLGMLVSLFAQLGDLVASLCKRNMGVKDASSFLPGHGGFFDRMDSLLFAGVVVYYYVLILSIT